LYAHGQRSQRPQDQLPGADDSGDRRARKLKEAGVSVIATRYNGMIHDFVLLNGILTEPEP